MIEDAALKILREKSKDIRALSFLSFSYLKKGNWEEYVDIFDGLAVLSEQNYDALFPDRERAKQLAFKWLSEERYNGLVTEKKPVEGDYDHIVRLVGALAKIKAILEQKFPDGSPFPSELYKSAQMWEKATKPKPKAPPPPPPVVAAVVTAATSSATGDGSAATASNTETAAPTVAVTAAAEPMDSPKQAQTTARKVASFLIDKEPLKPMGYRLMRSSRWDLIEKAPPAEGGKTQLSGPQPQQRTYFQNLIAQKDWKTALEKAEATFAAGANHLWLDLQRIIATSCKELGDTYVPVKNAVLFETAILVKRIPDLTSLSFSDGAPFCDDATKDWITTEVSAIMSGSGAGGQGGSKSGDVFEEEQRTVNAMVAANQIEDALDLLQKGMRTNANERDNFRRSILIGTLLLKAKQPDLAISIFEALDLKIANSNLHHWEPDLVVEAWSMLAQAYKVSKIQKPQNIQIVIQEKQNTILSKISQIDPRKAFNLNK